MMNYTVLETLKAQNVRKAAMWFQTFLAVDKGVPSRIVKVGAALHVVADDNRAIAFSCRRRSDG